MVNAKKKVIKVKWKIQKCHCKLFFLDIFDFLRLFSVSQTPQSIASQAPDNPEASKVQTQTSLEQSVHPSQAPTTTQDSVQQHKVVQQLKQVAFL